MMEIESVDGGVDEKVGLLGEQEADQASRIGCSAGFAGRGPARGLLTAAASRPLLAGSQIAAVIFGGTNSLLESSKPALEAPESRVVVARDVMRGNC
jgi:hypothetical protein